MDLATIPREFPQYGRSVWNILRTHREVFGDTERPSSHGFGGRVGPAMRGVFGREWPSAAADRVDACGRECDGPCSSSGASCGCSNSASHQQHRRPFAAPLVARRGRFAIDRFSRPIMGGRHAPGSRSSTAMRGSGPGWGYEDAPAGGPADMAPAGGKDCGPTMTDEQTANQLACMVTFIAMAAAGPASAAAGALILMLCLKANQPDTTPFGCVVVVTKSDCTHAPYVVGTEWCVACDKDDKGDCFCPVGKESRGRPFDIPLNATPGPSSTRCNVSVKYKTAKCARCEGAGWLV